MPKEAFFIVNGGHLVKTLFTFSERQALNIHPQLTLSYLLLPDSEVIARIHDVLPQFQAHKVIHNIETDLFALQTSNEVLKNTPLTVEQIIVLLYLVNQELGQVELISAVQLCLPPFFDRQKKLMLNKKDISPEAYKLLKRSLTRMRHLDVFAGVVLNGIHKPYPMKTRSLTTLLLKPIVAQIQKKIDRMSEWVELAEQIEVVMEKKTP